MWFFNHVSTHYVYSNIHWTIGLNLYLDITKASRFIHAREISNLNTCSLLFTEKVLAYCTVPLFLRFSIGVHRIISHAILSSTTQFFFRSGYSLRMNSSFAMILKCRYIFTAMTENVKNYRKLNIP